MQNLMSHADQAKVKIIVLGNRFLSIEKHDFNAGNPSIRITLNHFQVNSIAQFHERLLGSSLCSTMLSWRFLFSTKAKYLFTTELQQDLEFFCKHIEEKVYTNDDLNFTADENMLLEILRVTISWNCSINKIYVAKNLNFHSENAARLFVDSLEELSHFIEKTNNA